MVSNPNYKEKESRLYVYVYYLLIYFYVELNDASMSHASHDNKTINSNTTKGSSRLETEEQKSVKDLAREFSVSLGLKIIRFFINCYVHM